MKRFGNLFLVSLLSGATTLGAYKLLFDSDLMHSKSIVTVAPENYSRNVGLGAEAIDTLYVTEVGGGALTQQRASQVADELTHSLK